jgi:hypothetical protein
MADETEQIRKERIVEINSDEITRESLESKHGEIWDTTQLQQSFTVLGFMSPYCIVEKNGTKGSVEFSHSPRFYFNFQAD